MDKEKRFCVYKHTCPNGKVYIGITSKKPEYRWSNGKGYKGNIHFTRAIEKYGWSNIKHNILHENLTEQDAKIIEMELIKLHNSDNTQKGYNKTLGGDGTLGHIMTLETKKKISIANSGSNNGMCGKRGELSPSYGRKLSKEQREKLSKLKKGLLVGESHPMYGKTHKEEVKKKISKKSKEMWENEKIRTSILKHLSQRWENEEYRKRMSEIHKGQISPMKNRKHTEESKIKISQAHKGKKLSKETKEKMGNSRKGDKNWKATKVICVTTNKIFDYIGQAGEFYGIKSHSHISQVCKGTRNYCGKLSDGTQLQWMYLEDYENKYIE